MSTTATDVFDRSAYEAPESNLLGEAEQTENKLFSAVGRIGIWQYNALFTKVMLVVVLAAAAIFGAMATESQVLIAVIGAPALLVVLVAYVALIFAAVKRLHDLGHSGWFYLIGLIPLVGVIFMLYYALKSGHEDDNQYGEPRAATQSDKVFGVIGMILLIGLNIVALVPMG